jgi:hypothetical protein
VLEKQLDDSSGRLDSRAWTSGVCKIASDLLVKYWWLGYSESRMQPRDNKDPGGLNIQMSALTPA